MRKIILLLLTGITALGLFGFSTPECRICGMYIERFKKTAAQVDYKDGKSEAYCGVSCAIRAINEKGGFDAVKSASVTGWTSQEEVDPKQATYVIGSKLIPDMLPNIIAFGSKEEAQAFIGKEGGRVESLDSLMVSTSYRGLTAPFRIPSAAVPSQGVFNAGATFNAKRMHGLMKGSGDISEADAFKTKTMVPKNMMTYMAVEGLGYGVTDDLFCSLNIPYAWKDMDSARKNGTSVNFDSDGLGDIPLSARWRFWHDAYFDKHIALLGSVSFPSGEFDNTIRDKPTMQLGTGAFAFSPGLAYSQHIGKFWLHASGMYKWNLQNSDDYRYGDNINYGFAVHFLPNTEDLLGFEFDVDRSLRNKDKGSKVACTGRTTASCNFVYQRKVLLLWGGNMNIYALYGLPVYEDVKDIQLGEQFHVTGGFQWQRKF